MSSNTNALPAGYVLNEYRVESVLGVGGFASEAYELTDAERLRCAEIVADEAGPGTPLIIGMAAGSTYAAIQQARQVAALRPAALMVLPPSTSPGMRTTGWSASSQSSRSASFPGSASGRNPRSVAALTQRSIVGRGLPYRASRILVGLGSSPVCPAL